LNGVYSNNAESFFSRLRRAEMGHHHHVAGPYLVRYAQESAWRENNRRVSKWASGPTHGVAGVGFAAFAGLLPLLAAAQGSVVPGLWDASRRCGNLWLSCRNQQCPPCVPIGLWVEGLP
jgi:hypothetical protein